MFKTGDVIRAIKGPFKGRYYIVTRVYNKKIIAASKFDSHGPLLIKEKKVESEYFEKVDEEKEARVGLTFKKMMQIFVSLDFFQQKDDGTYKFNFSDDTSINIEPRFRDMMEEEE